MACIAGLTGCFYSSYDNCIHKNPKIDFIIGNTGLKIKTICSSYVPNLLWNYDLPPIKPICPAGHFDCEHLSYYGCRFKNPDIDTFDMCSDAGLEYSITTCKNYKSKGENTMDMKKVDEIRMRLNNDSIIDFYDSTLQASMKKAMREGCEAIDYLKACLDNQEKEIKAIYEENGKLQKRLKEQIRENAKLNVDNLNLKRQISKQKEEDTKYEVKITDLKNSNENLFQKLNELREKKKEKSRKIWPGEIFTFEDNEYIVETVDVNFGSREIGVKCKRYEDWQRKNIHLFLHDVSYNIDDLSKLLEPRGFKIVPKE